MHWTNYKVLLQFSNDRKLLDEWHYYFITHQVPIHTSKKAVYIDKFVINTINKLNADSLSQFHKFCPKWENLLWTKFVQGKNWNWLNKQKCIFFVNYLL